MKVKALRWILFGSILMGVIFAFIIIHQKEERPSYIAPPPSKEPPKKIVLYFSCPEMEGFVPESFWIERKQDLVDEVKLVLNRLIEGPKGNGLVATIPPKTRLRELYISKGIAYPDFSREFIENHWGGTTGEIHTVYSIVNTLALNFEEIEKVQLLVEGRGIETIAGHLDLRRPLSPNLRLISTR
jgi:spore germination protein GerM